MKTLEQVIAEAIRPHYIMAGDQITAIAAAVREWMRGHNEGLRKIIDTCITTLQSERPDGAYIIYDNSTREKLVDVILSVIPPPRDEMFQSGIAVMEKRITELEAEVERLTEKQELWNASEANHVALRDKAAKYDELRRRFPYLPGDTVYTLMFLPRESGYWVLKYRVLQISTERCYVARDGDDPVWIDTKHCHPTAEACRAAIPVWPKD